MVAIPRPESSTVRSIYEAYEAANEQRDGRSISVSKLAEECARSLFYEFRWASPQEHIPGRTLSIFRTGVLWEERWIENLRSIGCEVVDRDDRGNQIMVTACDGHVRGYLDSEILGLPEAPSTIHVGEIKSHNAKSFTALKKDGVQKAKWLHYTQLQTYMHLRGRDRGIYLAVDKNSDELYAERLHVDHEHVMRMLARAQRIIDANEPPAKLHEDPNHKMAFACGWCRHKPICHEHAKARVNCRTCIYASPEFGGSWACARHSKPLSIEEQQAGCPNHIWLPGFVDGEQIDADEAAETVTYKMWNGATFVDGAANDDEQQERVA